MKKKIAYYSLLFFLLLSFVLTFVYILREGLETYSFTRSAIRVRGEVVKVYFDEDAAEIFDVRFKVAGKWFLTSSNFRTNLKKRQSFNTKDSVYVLYLRSNPSVNKIELFEELYGDVLLDGVVSLSFFVAFLFCKRNRKWVEEQEGGVWPYG